MKNFIFLMDPLETVVPEKDTTLVLMHGAHKRGHNVYFLPNGGISATPKGVRLHVEKVVPQMNTDNPFIRQEKTTLNESEIDAVFIRTDPPFDAQYLMNTWLLDLLPKNKIVLNSPHGIRQANEKVWALQFKDLLPPTLVSRNKNDLNEFIDQYEEVIAKPTDGHGGKSVFKIRNGEQNTAVILETITDQWRKEIILQKYVHEAKEGDKRIILLNGEPLGAVLRVHSDTDHRNNFFSGGSAVASEITERDKEIINVIKHKLIENGLYFVGIDVMGPYLIEINVTSPTCLQEINRFNNVSLEDQVIEFTEKLIDQQKSIPTIQS